MLARVANASPSCGRAPDDIPSPRRVGSAPLAAPNRRCSLLGGRRRGDRGRRTDAGVAPGAKGPPPNGDGHRPGNPHGNGIAHDGLRAAFRSPPGNSSGGSGRGGPATIRRPARVGNIGPPRRRAEGTGHPPAGNGMDIGQTPRPPTGGSTAIHPPRRGSNTDIRAPNPSKAGRPEGKRSGPDGAPGVVRTARRGNGRIPAAGTDEEHARPGPAGGGQHPAVGRNGLVPSIDGPGATPMTPTTPAHTARRHPEVPTSVPRRGAPFPAHRPLNERRRGR
ncbi:hypothetical protein SAMN05421837_104576 [Amycolatopsis pretoriensis]|uniref:Uncharacterized protein n=1 Tax=Amycolatopsis pretoriensis TaxID=218821 RepID=A0A1H5QSQ9_9PSEU|nr:hypothetical protein SAMN05421837_104576 [Amycolatopsis pretoriensis]